MLVLAGEGHALTVVEIVTSDQTATNLVSQLFAFEGVVERSVGSRVGKPRRITLDCGQNVLVAICIWANGETVQQVLVRRGSYCCVQRCSLWQFLRRRWTELWSGLPNSSDKTIVCWCIAHLKKAASFHVKSQSKFRSVLICRVRYSWFCSCPQEMRKSFGNFAFRVLELVEQASTIQLVDSFISGCNDFLITKTLSLGETKFGAYFAFFAGCLPHFAFRHHRCAYCDGFNGRRAAASVPGAAVHVRGCGLPRRRRRGSQPFLQRRSAGCLRALSACAIDASFNYRSIFCL